VQSVDFSLFRSAKVREENSKIACCCSVVCCWVKNGYVYADDTSLNFCFLLLPLSKTNLTVL